MNRVSRRQVLKCAAGVAGTFGIPYFIPSGVLAADDKPGANERVTVGAIGVGNRASLLLDQLPKDGQIAALSDCNVPRAEAFKAKRKGEWPVYQHYQKILERKWSDQTALWQALWHLQNWIEWILEDDSAVVLMLGVTAE